MKRLATVFAVAFALNFAWENVHSLLYSNYMGGPITEFILLRATLADAVMITAVAAPLLFISVSKTYRRLVILLYVLIWLGLAIAIELFALDTGRWAYNASMPVIPILDIGLTPTIQLVLLGFLSLRLTERFAQPANIGQV